MLEPAVFLLFVTLTWTQTVQDAWISPAPPDFTDTLTIGESFNISWKPDLLNSFAFYAPSVDVSSVDLWVTDFNLHVYSHRIAGMS